METKPRVDTSAGRPSIEKCLPRDALEEVAGHLDQETLCTACLVSKTFCAAASVHVYNLPLPEISPGVSFHRLPPLRRVAVVLNRVEESLAQLDPRLRELASSLTMEFPRSTPIETLSEAALLPKLQSLEVHNCIKGGAASLRQCTDLEALWIHYSCSASVAATIITMTRLTSLRIGIVTEEDGRWAGASWFELTTNLRNLQELGITAPYEAVPLIAKLTGLTGLTVYHARMLTPTYSMAPLSRLSRLKSLHILMNMIESNLGIACSLGSGSLVDLELYVSPEAPPECGSFLSRQTALTRLSLGGPQLCNLQHIGALRMELLQCLKLDALDVQDGEGLAVLQRATSLTKLGINTRITQPQVGLSEDLGRLTQLRSLRLEFCGGGDPRNVLDLPLALTPLTALTKLFLYAHVMGDGGLPALLVLTGLHVLKLCNCPLTNEVVPELGVLTNLHTLNVVECGVASLAPVGEVLDPLRIARGLPPMKTSVEWL